MVTLGGEHSGISGHVLTEKRPHLGFSPSSVVFRGDQVHCRLVVVHPRTTSWTSNRK